MHITEGVESGLEMRDREEEDEDEEMGDLLNGSSDEVCRLLHSSLSTNSKQSSRRTGFGGVYHDRFVDEQGLCTCCNSVSVLPLRLLHPVAKCTGERAPAKLTKTWKKR
jgi:hypothetical protein